MREKRTSVNFDKHEHRVEIFKCKEKEIRVDHFQIGDSRMKYIKFVNTEDTLTVSGDYGNWVFCRPFVPSADGYVSDCYWFEKLRMLSEQKFDILDFDLIQQEIKELIDSGIKERFREDNEKTENAIAWFKELLDIAESEDHIEYTWKAYRDYSMPDFIEYEMIPFTKKIPTWIKIIFDAFDEICNRLEKQN